MNKILLGMNLLLSLAFSRQILVSESVQLMDAMSGAIAGDTILVEPGEYQGDRRQSKDPGNLPNGQGFFWVGNEGSHEHPILIMGTDSTQPPILKGTDINSGYVVHVTGDYVYLKNLIITQGDKGVVFDHSNYSILEGCEIHNVGAELVHIRDGSSHVILNKNKIWNSGNAGNGSIGEGIYVGTDQARWGSDDFPQSSWGDMAISEGYGGYDWRVENTQISCNYLSGSISAETMDIKEGTRNTLVMNNVLVGDSIGKKPGAASYDDSFIDIKGVQATFLNNSFCNCGNSLDRFINEVTRKSFAHIPNSLTTDAHAKPWCDESALDKNHCSEAENEIIEIPFDPRDNCEDLIKIMAQDSLSTPVLYSESIPKNLNTEKYNVMGQSLNKTKSSKYVPYLVKRN